MRIVSLEPFITEVICSLGALESLVGVSHRCDYPKEVDQLPRVTTPSVTLKSTDLAVRIGADTVDLGRLKELKPDLVLSSLPVETDGSGIGGVAECRVLEEELSTYVGQPVRFRSFFPCRLEGIFETFELIGVAIGKGAAGRDLAQRCKAQCMDWGDNFYDRMRNKKVTFISSVSPLCIAGYWVPDMIHHNSCVSQHQHFGEDDLIIEWKHVEEFNPDTLIIAPRGVTLEGALKTFKMLEKLPNWETILAVKRGEVFFTDGNPHFYRPSARIIESMGVLVSCLSGIDSGYITARDSFYRLRWLELHRHKIE